MVALEPELSGEAPGGAGIRAFRTMERREDGSETALDPAKSSVTLMRVEASGRSPVLSLRDGRIAIDNNRVENAMSLPRYDGHRGR
jgi:hypothetical protein